MPPNTKIIDFMSFNKLIWAKTACNVLGKQEKYTFFSPQITETLDTKAANDEGRLYFKITFLRLDLSFILSAEK